MKFRSTAFVLVSLSVFTVAGCGSSSTPSGTGGNSGTGGVSGSGGAPGSGGATGTGGSSGTGGRTGTGGEGATGGVMGTGGATGTGGRGGGAAGGATGTGGRGGGGGGGGAANNGGRGGAAGGANGAGGATTATMSFFVTSRGFGNGGNLMGLTGADTFCTTLATAVSPALGAKMWHAYLSTAAENARDRIGMGPWRNAAGVVIANNLTDLHDQLPANAALNATWPVGSTSIALDERGNQLPANPLVHDILTGSNAAGTVMAGLTCNDWTSNATTVMGQVGHTNRAGNNVPSWNSTHATSGCAEPTADMMNGTVSSGGGRGSIYCFAVGP